MRSKTGRTGVNVPVQAKSNPRGKYLPKKSRLKLKGNGKAPQGTRPRKDVDTWTLQCMPNASCP